MDDNGAVRDFINYFYTASTDSFYNADCVPLILIKNISLRFAISSFLASHNKFDILSYKLCYMISLERKDMSAQPLHIQISAKQFNLSATRQCPLGLNTFQLNVSLTSLLEMTKSSIALPYAVSG